VAIVQLARHLDANRDRALAAALVERRLYDIAITVDAALDVRDARVTSALSLHDAPGCFRALTIARATVTFLRATTPARSLIVPLAAFLDDPTRWIAVLFREKLPTDLTTVVPSVTADGVFRLDTTPGTPAPTPATS